VTDAWIVVGALFLGTAAIKAAGPLAIGGRRPSGRALRVIALVAPALLAGLVVYETLITEDGGIGFDARIAGVVAAVAAIAARLPMIAVVLLAAAATALVRAIA
jgi:hypothetical protein